MVFRENKLHLYFILVEFCNAVFSHWYLKTLSGTQKEKINMQMYNLSKWIEISKSQPCTSDRIHLITRSLTCFISFFLAVYIPGPVTLPWLRIIQCVTSARAQVGFRMRTHKVGLAIVVVFVQTIRFILTKICIFWNEIFCYFYNRMLVRVWRNS